MAAALCSARPRARARRRGVSRNSCNRCGPRRRSSASRARPSTRRRAGSSPICRCPISRCRGAPTRRRSSPSSCRRRRTMCAKARSRGSPRRARSSWRRTARRSMRSSGNSACSHRSLLAIWGRETAYGGYKLPHDAMRVLATQAYTGRRKDMFRGEFLAALKMLQDGVPREKMRSSWGGAMGLTQFLPSEFYKHARRFRRRRQGRHLDLDPGRARVGGEATRQQGLAARRTLGLRGARAGRRRLHHRRSPAMSCRSANGSSAAMRRPTAASSRPMN